MNLVAAFTGAPVVSRTGRPTLLVVSALCVIKFAWTLVHERSVLSAWHVALAALGVLVFLLVFAGMCRQGHRLARRTRQ